MAKNRVNGLQNITRIAMYGIKLPYAPMKRQRRSRRILSRRSRIEGCGFHRRELKELVIITGIPYETLISQPHYNPQAIERLKNSEIVDQLLQKYAAYMPEIIKVRNRILAYEGFDFFEHSRTLSPAWLRQADQEYQRVIRRKDDSSNTELVVLPKSF
jgi:hypothetical protein